jgi:hypothetical protein
LSPVAGRREQLSTDQIPGGVTPHVSYFDSVWIADQFYGFDKEKKEGFLEGWVR